MSLVVAVVGLCGAGKTEVAKILESLGYQYLRFGQITIDLLNKKGLEVNEKNERRIREALRRKYGMSAYARLNIPKIKELLRKGDVVIDGLYSWEEYLLLRKTLKKRLVLLCVFTPKAVREKRLGARKERPLEAEEIESRDIAEIENSNKAGPIAFADFLIVNDSTKKELRENVKKVARLLKRQQKV